MAFSQVVKVFATTQTPDQDSPWQANSPSSGTGSGVVIGPNEVLTGAHVVANGTFIQLQKLSDPDKATARIKAICHDADLALLEVDDPAFLPGIPAQLGELPARRDKVSVVGFPIGGEEVSITEGVVSRIEMQRYSHSQRQMLAVTVDAAINDGNSGGPVFRGGLVVGIAFQSLTGADNIGEIVPAPIIRRFLKGVETNRCQLVPNVGLGYQLLENAVLRRESGLGPDDSGVLVTEVGYETSADGIIEVGDALIEIGGASIANNGTVSYLDKYRTNLLVMLTDYFVGDELTVTVLRKGVRKELVLTLRAPNQLVPRSMFEVEPAYFVYAGLVFQPLTRDFLETWEEWWHRAPKEFLYEYERGRVSPERSEAIVLSKMLADEINNGYAHLCNECVRSVNGNAPKDMRALVDSLVSAEGIVTITTTSGGVIKFDSEQVKSATSRILQRYRMIDDRSRGLRE